MLLVEWVQLQQVQALVLAHIQILKCLLHFLEQVLAKCPGTQLLLQVKIQDLLKLMKDYSVVVLIQQHMEEQAQQEHRVFLGLTSELKMEFFLHQEQVKKPMYQEDRKELDKLVK